VNLVELLAPWAKADCPVFKARGLHREAHFEGDINHWRSKARRLTDDSLDSHQIGVFVSRASHASFNQFTEQRLLTVQTSRVASKEWQSNGISAWRSETCARISGWGPNEIDVRE
jgi:hypothetical protein